MAVHLRTWKNERRIKHFFRLPSTQRVSDLRPASAPRTPWVPHFLDPSTLECDDPEPRAQTTALPSPLGAFPQSSPCSKSLASPSSPDLPAAGLACPLFACSRSGSTSGSTAQLSTAQLLTLQSASFWATSTLFFPVAQAKNLESSLTPFPHAPLLFRRMLPAIPLKHKQNPTTSRPPLLQQPRRAKQPSAVSQPWVSTSPCRRLRPFLFSP